MRAHARRSLAWQDRTRLPDAPLALLLLGGVLVYPLGWEIWTSFTYLSSLQDGGTAFVGLENYRRQLEDSQFRVAATVTIVHAAVTTAANKTGPT